MAAFLHAQFTGSLYGFIDATLEVASLSLVPVATRLLQPLAPPSTPADARLSYLLGGWYPLLFFFFCSFVYFCFDTAAPSWVARYKHQGVRGIVPRGAYPRAVAVALCSWFLVGLPWAWLTAVVLGPLRGAPPPSAPWRATELLFHFPCYIAIIELLFYASHRLLHAPCLFPWVHKMHHAFTAPFAVAAVYAHPLEHLVSNILSISAGPLVMGSHPVSACLWACFCVASTTAAHGGYTFSPDGSHHDVHHQRFDKNYGVGVYLLDRVGSTYAAGGEKGE